MTWEAKQLHKRALNLVKITKREYYLKLTEDTDAQNMWNFRKWMCRKHIYTSPALSRGDNDMPTVAHSDKCNLLRNTLFPPQPMLTDEPLMNLEPRAKDMEYHEVTKWEACDALFTAAPMNALASWE